MLYICCNFIKTMDLLLPPYLYLHVIGGRKFGTNKREKEFITNKLNKFLSGYNGSLRRVRLISAGFTGADRCACDWAISKGIPIVIIPANPIDGERGPSLRDYYIFDIATYVIKLPGGVKTEKRIEKARRRDCNIIDCAKDWVDDDDNCEMSM